MSTTVFGRTPAPLRYKGVNSESRYLRMGDGVSIAVDIMRPLGLAPETRLPTILIFARYWRSFALRGFEPKRRALVGPRQALPDFLLGNGYAVVVVDTRGSGASSGFTPYPFNRRELADYAEVVEWVIAQPWSNGKVGATGISYEGIAAELLCAMHPAATKVVIPQQADIDQYAECFMPGGILNQMFLSGWQQTNEDLDQNRVPLAFGRLTRIFIKGVRPVDEDRDGSLLAQAVREHRHNADVTAYSRSVTYRDDPFGASGVSLDELSSCHYRQGIEASGTALFTWGSWLDGATADGVLRRFVSYRNPQRAVIGAWSHRYLNHASPYCKPKGRLRPELKMLWQEMVDYFDRYLQQPKASDSGENRLYYYTLGEEVWKQTSVWPPAGSQRETWYLQQGHGLSRHCPDAESGSDDYKVDFEVTTGRRNRWWAQDGVTKAVYPDRAREDQCLLCYTSAPLEEDMEITGHPVITLYLSSTTEDGAFFVYLEEVDEAGRVTYITEGQLRALHRKTVADETAARLAIPYHSFLRKDGMPLQPGEVSEVSFHLLPTSVLVRKGRRLRVAIAGHDKDSFVRIPAQGEPVISVQRNRVYASFIELPVVHRGDDQPP